MINLLKPLQRVFRVTTPDDTTHTGLLKYERLPIFCFSCGIVGHMFWECPTTQVDNLKVSDLNYGAWLGGVDNLISDQIFSKTVREDNAAEDGASIGNQPDDAFIKSAITSPVPPGIQLSHSRSGTLVDNHDILPNSQSNITPQKWRSPEQALNRVQGPKSIG